MKDSLSFLVLAIIGIYAFFGTIVEVNYLVLPHFEQEPFYQLFIGLGFGLVKFLVGGILYFIFRPVLRKIFK